MNLIDRYICRTIIGTTVIVILALLSMDFFIQLINQIEDVGKGNYGILQAMFYVLLELPRDVYQLFPMAGLIGCLMGLGILAANSELIVMRAAGISLGQITKAVLFAVIGMVIIITLLGEWVGPKTIFYGEKFKAMARSGGQAVATRQGIWLRDGSDFIHIFTVESTKELTGITRYQFDAADRMTEMSFAAHALYQQHVWQVEQVSQSQFLPSGEVKTQTIPTTEWKMQLNPDVLKIAQVDPEEMTLPKLYKLIEYRKHNGLRYNNIALNFWQRLIQPFATCVMMLLAIPFIFGPLRSATMGLRLVAGVIVGFSFYILNQLFGPISLVYMFPPILAAIVPVTLFALIGAWFVRKMG